MNVKLLIDAVIQQTTILIAQLATTAGLRAPLAHVANQVFLELANEIESQGVSRKVAADMFGLALRSYQLKVQRLAESVTERDVSLWEAVLAFVQESGVVLRADVLRHFYHDDGASVRAILHDLVESGLIFQTGRGDATAYRATTTEEVTTLSARDARQSAVPLVWIVVYRTGPVTLADLTATLSLDVEVVEEALQELVGQGQVRLEQGGEEALYRCERCVIPIEEPAGWEAAIFDHFNSVVTAILVKLRQLHGPDLPRDAVGGSTYSFDIHEDHPHSGEVLALLRETRMRVGELRRKVSDHNEAHGRPPHGGRKVTFYFGQSVIEQEAAPEAEAPREEWIEE